jgi:hypothetical protein
MPTENHASPLIVNAFGDHYFHDVNGSAFNKLGSDTLYKKHFGNKLIQKDMLYIIVGTDSGLLPNYLLAAGLPEGAYYIFVELPEILDRLDAMLPTENIDNHILLTTPDKWEGLAQEMGIENYIFLRRLMFFRSIGAEDLHMEGYQECGLQVEEAIEKLKFVVRYKMESKLFMTQQLENLCENRVSAACMEGAFKGRTAVILGGGPSLDEALPWLEENRSHLDIIAVSRISRRLIEYGLVPDMVVSIDPNRISFDASKEALLLRETSLFVNMYHVYSGLLGQWRGRNVVIGPRFPWQTPWNDDNLELQFPGPTVTNTAIDLAVQMGFTRIFLTGVNLCNSKEGFTHAKGSIEHTAGPKLGGSTLRVKTYAGWYAETGSDFSLAIKTIAQQAEQATKLGCRLYNLSENAARVPGVDFLAPSEVVLTPQSESASEIIDRHLPEENQAARVAYLNDILPELDSANSAFKEIKRLSEKALSANDRFWGRKGSAKGHPKYRKQINSIEKKLNDDFKIFARQVKRIALRRFLGVAYRNDERELDKTNVDQSFQRYYEAYRDGAQEMLTMVENTRIRLFNRLEEENERPDFNALIEQWRQDDQPGRALVWKTRHGQQAVPEALAPEFETLETAFHTTTKESKTGPSNKTRQELNNVHTKLNLMFKRREKDRLDHLVNSLKTVEEPLAEILYHLGAGFSHELSGKTEEALNKYQYIIDHAPDLDNDQILETTLLRLFSIFLSCQDTQNALISSQCLSEISPVYLPYHADIRRLAGDRMGALDTYTEYLKKAPADISAMMKLGQLYVEIGNTESARKIFESVLKSEPENRAARQLISSLPPT